MSFITSTRFARAHRPEGLAVRISTFTANKKAILALSLAAFSSVAVIGTVLVVRGRSAHAAAPSALTQDLELAATQPVSLDFPLTETAPTATLQRAPTIKRASGPKAIRSRKPTVRAREEQTVAAESEVQETETIAEAPGVGETEAAAPSDAPATPRPVPVPVSLPGNGDGSQVGQGTSDGAGSGIGAVIGGILGGIIRGGTVDGDHCEIHDRRGRRRGPVVIGGGVYTPNTGGVWNPSAGGAGGTMGGGSRFPTRPRGR